MQMIIRYTPERYFGNNRDAKEIELKAMTYGNRIRVTFNYTELIRTSDQMYSGLVQGGEIVLSRNNALMFATALLRACTVEEAKEKSEDISYVLKE